MQIHFSDIVPDIHIYNESCEIDKKYFDVAKNRIESGVYNSERKIRTVDLF